jgi:hypothetical protein
MELLKEVGETPISPKNKKIVVSGEEVSKEKFEEMSKNKNIRLSKVSEDSDSVVYIKKERLFG